MRDHLALSIPSISAVRTIYRTLPFATPVSIVAENSTPLTLPSETHFSDVETEPAKFVVRKSNFLLPSLNILRAKWCRRSHISSVNGSPLATKQ